MTSIILASGSSARKAMLQQANVPFETLPARIDEESIKASLIAENAKPRDIVDTLAEYKARQIAGKAPQALVIGSDQILVADGEIISKSSSLEEAKELLKKLRGKPHDLIAAAVIYEDGKPAWRHISKVRMFMRDYSDGFIDDYLARNGETVLNAVGCYMFEGDGVNLFSRVEGDYYAILGMPLIDVLNFLRLKGAIEK